MRRLWTPALLFAIASQPTHAEPTTFATNGAWTTVGDTSGLVKRCVVQAENDGGWFAIWGATDRQNILRLSLYKPTWHIADTTAPIVLSFSSGELLKFSGLGSGSFIRTDIPTNSVKNLIHHFTADASMTVTLPEGHEGLWTFDLQGTTPATLAMAPCIDAAGLFLPPPFRAPLPQSPPDAAQPLSSTAPSVATAAEAQTDGRQEQNEAADTSFPRAEPTTSQDVKAQAGSTFYLIIMLAIVAFCAFVYRYWSKRKALTIRQGAVRKIIMEEIQAQAENLRIRKLQLTSRDIYGTWDYTKWHKERERFYETRIKPLIWMNDMTSVEPPIEITLGLIEAAASQNANPPISTYQSSPDEYDPRMSPIDYELLCARKLIEGGWDARTTIATGDQGADVIAMKNGVRLVVQCKLYTSSIGNDAVQQVYAAMKFQSAHVAVVVSNQPYTRSAVQLAATNGVQLLHHDQLSTFEHRAA